MKPEMKKEYIVPDMKIVQVFYQHSLMDISCSSGDTPCLDAKGELTDGEAG